MIVAMALTRKIVVSPKAHLLVILTFQVDFLKFCKSLVEFACPFYILDLLLHDCVMHHYFACMNPETRKIERCIARNWVCDGEKDCKHGDDEPAICGELYWLPFESILLKSFQCSVLL